MSGEDNFDALLDADDLLRPDSAALGFPKMIRATAREAVKAAYRAASRPTATATATETATLREHIQGILDHEYSYVMITFAGVAIFALILSIAIIFIVAKSLPKVKACMPPPGDDNGLGQNMYKCYRKTQMRFIFLILSALGCIGTFILATAKIMLLDNIDGSVDLLSIAYGVQVLTLLCTLMASHSLMNNTLLTFISNEADMEVNEWSSKL
ncbi:hypothetical protein DER46DRAFT_680226 [Fusarium sp. MPI-SDFR-AT-0072]|nr:hypothetical protein DER46DRAFT_680226 [Fusarium sp. MPI-SDFR-AT-0072]